MDCHCIFIISFIILIPLNKIIRQQSIVKLFFFQFIIYLCNFITKIFAIIGICYLHKFNYYRNVFYPSQGVALWK